MYEYFFNGKKPSLKQVQAKVNEGIKQGHDYLEISWGENLISIDIQLVNDKRSIFCGHGWIRDISGDDIAQELNRAQARANNATLNLWNS